MGEDHFALATQAKKKRNEAAKKAAAVAAARAAPPNIRTYFYDEEPLAALTRSAEQIEAVADTPPKKWPQKGVEDFSTTPNPLAELLGGYSHDEPLEAAAKKGIENSSQLGASLPPKTPPLDPESEPATVDMDAELASFMGDLEASGLLAENEAELEKQRAASLRRLGPSGDQRIATGGSAPSADTSTSLDEPTALPDAAQKEATPLAVAAAASRREGKEGGRAEEEQPASVSSVATTGGAAEGGEAQGAGEREGGGEDGGAAASEQRVLGEVQGAPGWQEVLDVASGTVYFWNAELQQTRGYWEPPEGAILSPRGTEGAPGLVDTAEPSSTATGKGGEPKPVEHPAAEGFPVPDEEVGRRAEALVASVSAQVARLCGEVSPLVKIAVEAGVRLRDWQRLAELQREASKGRRPLSLWQAYEQMTQDGLNALESKVAASVAEAEAAAQKGRQQQQGKGQLLTASSGAAASPSRAEEPAPLPPGESSLAGVEESEMEEGEMEAPPPLPEEEPAPPLPPPAAEKEAPQLAPLPAAKPAPGAAFPQGAAALAGLAATQWVQAPPGISAEYHAWLAQYYAHAMAHAAGAYPLGAAVAPFSPAAVAAAPAKPLPTPAVVSKGPVVKAAVLTAPPAHPQGVETPSLPHANGNGSLPTGGKAEAPKGGAASKGAQEEEEERKRKRVASGGGPLVKRKKAGLKADKHASALINKWAAVKKDLEEQEHREDNKDAIEAAQYAEELERKWEAEAAAWRAEQAALGLFEEENPFAQLGRGGGNGGSQPSPSPEPGAKPKPASFMKGGQPDLVAASRDLPPGWKAMFDKEQKQIYYGNPTTKLPRKIEGAGASDQILAATAPESGA